MNGTVDWTGAVAGSTFTLGVAGQALWLNHASVSEFSLYDYPTIPFGPVATPFLVRSTSGHYFGNNGSDGTWLYLVGFANPPLATGGGVLWSGISPVPEASSWLMLAAGLAMLRVTRWHSVRQGRRAVPA